MAFYCHHSERLGGSIRERLRESLFVCENTEPQNFCDLCGISDLVRDLLVVFFYTFFQIPCLLTACIWITDVYEVDRMHVVNGITMLFSWRQLFSALYLVLAPLKSSSIYLSFPKVDLFLCVCVSAIHAHREAFTLSFSPQPADCLSQRGQKCQRELN